MRFLDEQYLATPFYGSRRMTRELRLAGFSVNRKRVKRLMAQMGICAVYPRPKTSKPHPPHRVYPYLLRDLTIDRPGQVWWADVTYIPLATGLHVSGGYHGLAFPPSALLAPLETPSMPTSVWRLCARLLMPTEPRRSSTQTRAHNSPRRGSSVCLALAA